MGGLILPSGYKKKREVDPTRFRGYAKHLPCGGEAFWFTRFGKAWFDLEFSEVYFEDGQIKFKHKPIEDYTCPHCRKNLEGKDLRLVKIIQNDEAESLHAIEHAKKQIGELCELCGERRRKGDLERRNQSH